MKKYNMFAIIILIFLIMICSHREVKGDVIVITNQNEIIQFKDKNLEAGITEKINKPLGNISIDDVINIEDLSSLTKLSSLDLRNNKSCSASNRLPLPKLIIPGTQ